MPELPEVEIIRRQLHPQLVGKTIARVEVYLPKSFRADPEAVIGRRLTATARHGKVLILKLDEPPHLYIHLKMSGRLKVANTQGRAGDTRHLRATISFTDWQRLQFHDQRTFGWITTNPGVLPAGPDALDPQLTTDRLQTAFQTTRRPIKLVLTDQDRIAGIGNIYACEILWRAQIHPKTPASALRPSQLPSRDPVANLLDATRSVLPAAIAAGGTTIRLYRDALGQRGSFQHRFAVYDREGEPCPRCGTAIVREVLAQRSTYWCPGCQRR